MRSGGLSIMIDKCYTILNSIVADWVATHNLFAKYGASAEANPIVRQMGPDFPVGIVTLLASQHCHSLPNWLAIATWAVETIAVNAHVAIGTAVTLPQIVFIWRW